MLSLLWSHLTNVRLYNRAIFFFFTCHPGDSPALCPKKLLNLEVASWASCGCFTNGKNMRVASTPAGFHLSRVEPGFGLWSCAEGSKIQQWTLWICFSPAVFLHTSAPVLPHFSSTAVCPCLCPPDSQVLKWETNVSYLCRLCCHLLSAQYQYFSSNPVIIYFWSA